MSSWRARVNLKEIKKQSLSKLTIQCRPTYTKAVQWGKILVFHPACQSNSHPRSIISILPDDDDHQIQHIGCRHCSVDSSVPTILLPRVRVPCIPPMLLSFIVKFVLYLSCEKNIQINKKRPGLVHLIFSISQVTRYATRKYLNSNSL